MKMRLKLFWLYFLLLAPCSLLAQVQDSQIQTIQTLSERIKEHLAELKMQSIILTEKLEQSQSKAEALQIELSELYSSLNNTENALVDYVNQCKTYEERLKQTKQRLNRLSIFAACFIFLFVAVRIVSIWLKFKGIKIPDIINILL